MAKVLKSNRIIKVKDINDNCDCLVKGMERRAKGKKEAFSKI